MFRSHVAMNHPIAPPNTLSRFIKQAVATGFALLLISSIAPVTVLDTGFSADFFIDSQVLPEEFFLEDVDFFTTEDGFVLKTNQGATGDEDVDYFGINNEYVKHTVEEGETLSEIASAYGIKVKTIEDANNLSAGDTLRVGRTLIIYPIDGVEHTVSKNETLNKIAKDYSVEKDKIVEHNHLISDVLKAGQRVFIPGGKKKPQPVIVTRNGPTRSGRSDYNAFNKKDPTQGSYEKPQGSKSFIRPAPGKLTQGYSGRHPAHDIADPRSPEIVAAATGTVLKTVGGCAPGVGPRSQWDLRCNSGYGNYIVIDHGDDWKTLYAHLNSIYVEVGQDVAQGQSIGVMGLTGRTTGMHLHFECIVGGKKINPNECY